MVDRSDLPDVSRDDLVAWARDQYREEAIENAPCTVKFSTTGVTLGAVAFGPAGGVVGATVGSSIGYLTDQGFFDSEEEPEVINAEVPDDA